MPTFRRRAGALPGLLLALLAPLIYHRMLTPGWAPVGFDLLSYFGPNRHYLAVAWAHGRVFPLWNPDLFLGVPFLANIQNAVLYPPTLLFAVLPTPAAMAWELALHLAIAGAGMYAYAWRAERLGAPGALVAGAIYMLGGVLTAHLEHLNQDSTLAWTPWLMLATDRLAVRPTRRRMALVAALVALVILAGHTQQAYYTFVLATLAALGRLWPAVRRRRWRQPLVVVAAGLGAAGVGLLVAAAQLVPTLTLVRQGIRSSGLTPAEAGVLGLPFRDLAGSLVPDYLAQQGSEFAGYVGMAGLVLAVFAVVTRWRRPRVAFLAALALAGFWAALGVKGRLFEVLFYTVPGFGLFRVPARLLLFTTVALALLAGHGTRTAAQLAPAARRRRVVPLLAVTAVPFTALMLLLLADRAAGWPDRLIWRPLPVLPDADLLGLAAFSAAALAGIALVAGLGRRVPALAWALPALVLADLFVAGSHTNMRHPLPATIYAEPSAALQLAPAPRQERYLSIAQRPDQVPLPAGLGAYGLSGYDSARYEDALRWIAIDRPNIGLGSGHLDFDGYDGGILPLRAYVDFRRPLLLADSQNPPDFATQDLTRQVMDPARLRDAAVAALITNNGSDPNPPGCAGCLLPGDSVGGMTAWHLAAGPVSRAWIALPNGERRAARVQSDSGEQVVVAIPPGAGGRLVLADAWYPDWKASVNGRPVPIGKYEGFLREVDLPAGSTEVVFTYQATSFELGAAISLLGLLLLFALALEIPRRSRPR